MKQKYTVTIAGMTLNLVSDEQEEYVDGLVRLLDQRINEMVVSSKHCSKHEALLFCAIDYFDDKIKNSLRFQRMQETIDNLLKENEEMRARLGIKETHRELKIEENLSGELIKESERKANRKKNA